MSVRNIEQAALRKLKKILLKRYGANVRCEDLIAEPLGDSKEHSLIVESRRSGY
ncbi:hypothetical protein [Candidatus Seongchinamella marina]|uniref:hypothetical protein n=1 Tax=Candidatus Seongchinamella marina TaxID=2518990 RepID=UPI00242F0D02|nr:hypothetical protein [Candidatus Seongchinamella marina]